MFALKNLVTVVMGLGSSIAFAGTMGAACHSSAVHVPCEPAAWGFAADALYLQPSTTLNGYTYIEGVTKTSGELVRYPNPWAWGVYLEGFYHYGVGSDVNLNWSHFSHSSHQAYQDASFYFATPLADDQLTAKSDPRWDSVHFELGQSIALSEHKHVRLHGGFEYARFDNTATFNIENALANDYHSSVTTYNGFGPRLGIDLYYSSDYGLGVYSKGAMSILAGTTQFNTVQQLTEFTGGILATLRDSIAGGSIVPVLEGKLGATYAYRVPQGDLMFDLGWLWVDYFNVGNNFVTAVPDVFTGDFTLQGVYFGLKWRGHAL